MASADIGSALSSMFPTKAGVVGAGASGMFWLTIIIIIILFLVGGGIAIFLIIRSLQFNKKIDIYQWRDGKCEWVGKDKAKELKYNVYGDSVFVLRKRKKMLPRGDIAVARNRYLYGIREDGEWINISIGDLNSALRKAEVRFINPDMRAFKSGLAKIMKDRYDKPSMFKEYASIIIPIVVLVILSLAIYFVADKVVQGIDKSNKGVEIANQLTEKQDKILTGMNNICGGSGYTAVT